MNAPLISSIFLYITLSLVFLAGILVKTPSSADEYFSSRSTVGWQSLGFNFYSCSLGIGALYNYPYVGSTLGPVGVLSYTFATIFPILLLPMMGDIVKRASPDGVSLNTFIGTRFGYTAVLVTSFVSILYMFVFLVTEIATMKVLLEYYSISPLPAIIFACIITVVYSWQGGMNASIATDFIQGVVVLILSTVVLIAIAPLLSISTDQITQSPLTKPSRAGAFSITASS